jgi:hypothetical protein
MLIYLSIIISALAAIVGIISKSWNKEKKKFTKPDPLQLISLLLLIIGTVITLTMTIRNKYNEKNAADDRLKLRTMAYFQLTRESFKMMLPMMIILSDDDKNTKQYFDFNASPSSIARNLRSENSITFLRRHKFKSTSIAAPEDFSEKDHFYEKYDYNSFICNYQNADKLKKIRDDWVNYLDTEDLILIDSVINSRFYDKVKELRQPYDNESVTLFKYSSFFDNYIQYFISLEHLLLKVEIKGTSFLTYYMPESKDIISDVCQDIGDAVSSSYTESHEK